MLPLRVAREGIFAHLAQYFNVADQWVDYLNKDAIFRSENSSEDFWFMQNGLDNVQTGIAGVRSSLALQYHRGPKGSAIMRGANALRIAIDFFDHGLHPRPAHG